MKKNTFKKLMSAIVSMAMLVSMMVMPANAVVVGEEAYGTITLANYDINTRTTSNITVPDYYTIHSGIPTHEFLSEDDLEQINNEISTSAIIGEDNRQPVFYPNNSPYPGVVFILTLYDTNGDNIADDWNAGTGFLASSDTVITAMHVFYQTIAYNPSAVLLEARVYPELSVDADDSYLISDMAYLNVLNGKPYIEITSILHHSQYIAIYQSELASGTVNSDTAQHFNYDWAVATLSVNTQGYYFNCAPVASDITDMTLRIAGYPGDHLFRLYQSIGNATVYDSRINPYVFQNNIDAVGGQSGAPVYSTSDNMCYGIHIAGAGTSYNTAHAISPDVYNAIVRAMIY